MQDDEPTPESPFDTESEIKFIKSFQASTISDSHNKHSEDDPTFATNISLMRSGPTMTLDNIVSSSELSSMPDDNLHSMSAFDTVKSRDDVDVDMADSEHISKEGMADTFLNAFAEFHSLSGHLDHVREEVSNLHSRIADMESSILQSVSDEIKNSVPTLISELFGLLTDTLKACLPFILKDSLPTQLHKAVVKPMKKHFNIYHTAESEHFVTLQKALTKSMQNQLTDIQGLLESEVINDDTAEGEKNKKDKDANPAATQGEHQSAETIPSSGPTVESQGEQLADLMVANKESIPPVLDDKKNEGKELVVHNSEEKKSEGIISVEDDSDEDDLDKQPL
ncbi:hypothetical protein Tco_1412284 [Tanacetum coccineum]